MNTDSKKCNQTPLEKMQFFSNELIELLKIKDDRIIELETLVSEAYVVTSHIVNRYDLWERVENDSIVRHLDNLGELSRVHDDILPVLFIEEDDIDDEFISADVVSHNKIALINFKINTVIEYRYSDNKGEFGVVTGYELNDNGDIRLYVKNIKTKEIALHHPCDIIVV